MTTIEITEADIEFFQDAFSTNREAAIEMLLAEQKMKIEYNTYLESQFDPRD